jgi:hypothetical protein
MDFFEFFMTIQKYLGSTGIYFFYPLVPGIKSYVAWNILDNMDHLKDIKEVQIIKIKIYLYIVKPYFHKKL